MTRRRGRRWAEDMSCVPRTPRQPCYMDYAGAMIIEGGTAFRRAGKEAERFQD